MSEQTAGNPVQAVGYTDVGQRSHNEDAFLVNQDIGLIVVADGVGGHQAGEIASAMTCKVLEREATAGSTLDESIKIANVEVFEAVAQELGRAGMASTVVALQFNGLAWDLAWVGDSRAYLWDGQLGLLSRDHSLVESLIQSGQISLDEARNHPKKNVIDQAIGLQAEDSLRIGHNCGELVPGQVLLLCSDGLNDVLDSGEITGILSSGAPLEDRCRQLVMSAVDHGGRDNTTVVLLEVAGDPVANENAPQPNFVWRYNPADESYSGLPALKPRPQVAVSRVAPRVMEGTVIMQSPFAPGGARSEVKKRRRESRNLNYLWIAVGAVVVLVMLAGGLSLVGN